MSPQNLYLVHFNGRDDNLGDQFIFRALVHALADLGAVHIRRGAPAFIARTPRAPLTSGGWRLGWRSALTTMGGGTVFTFLPPGGRTWTAPAAAGAAARGGAAQTLKAVKARGRTLIAGRRIAIGTSVIPEADHSWCRECDWIGVRDHESLTALRAAGLPRVDYFPDLAFLPALPHPTDGPRHGVRVSFRNAIPEARDPQAYEHRLSEAFAAVLGPLAGHARRHVRGYHQVAEDEAFTRGLSRAHDITFDAPRVSLETFESFYRSAEIVISNRLHCLLMGASCGAVPVALTSRDHTKVTALFETVGWTPLVLPIEETAGHLQDRFAEIRRDLPRYRRLVAASFDEHRRLGLNMLAQRFGRARAE